MVTAETRLGGYRPDLNLRCATLVIEPAHERRRLIVAVVAADAAGSRGARDIVVRSHYHANRGMNQVRSGRQLGGLSDALREYQAPMELVARANGFTPRDHIGLGSARF